MLKRVGWFLLLILFFTSFSWAQEMGSTHFDMSEFPLWSRDLRRGSIIAFGAFPFAYFFSSFTVDTARWSGNSWDTRYAPWPFNSAGTIEKTEGEKVTTIGIAAGVSIVIALVDYGIMRSRRDRLERQRREIIIEPPHIIRTPLHGEESIDSAEETE